MNKDLPIYYVNIDDEDCMMTTISLVENPAIEHDFELFAKPKHTFTTHEEKHEIFGPVCLADTPIYRRREDGYEYQVVFTAEVIKKMMLKYSSYNFFNMVNLQHNENDYTENVKMIEFFVKDSALGINPVGFEDCPEGSLFARYKVLDEGLWNEIKTSGKFNGFSLEIVADLVEKMSKVEEDNKNEEDEFDKEIAELIGQSC